MFLQFCCWLVCSYNIVAQKTISKFSALVDGWRVTPENPTYREEKIELWALYSSNAHTIIIFAFLSSLFFAVLLYYSIIAYNEGYYYLYQLVQDGNIIFWSNYVLLNI